jgi:hypothetical protein
VTNTDPRSLALTFCAQRGLLIGRAEDASNLSLGGTGTKRPQILFNRGL